MPRSAVAITHGLTSKRKLVEVTSAVLTPTDVERLLAPAAVARLLAPAADAV